MISHCRRQVLQGYRPEVESSFVRLHRDAASLEPAVRPPLFSVHTNNSRRFLHGGDIGSHNHLAPSFTAWPSLAHYPAQWVPSLMLQEGTRVTRLPIPRVPTLGLLRHCSRSSVGPLPPFSLFRLFFFEAQKVIGCSCALIENATTTFSCWFRSCSLAPISSHLAETRRLPRLWLLTSSSLPRGK